MATADQIRRAQHHQPFQPFTIKFVDGTVFHITHPDFVSVPPAKHARELTCYVVNGDGEEYQTHWIDLGLVLDVITTSPSVGPEQRRPEGNGA
jgi:hypothetical protein